MSKTAWIIVAVIVVLIIAVVLFRRSQKKKEEEALAAMQAAGGSNAPKGTFADALASLIPVILANTKKDEIDKSVADTSNMGASSTNNTMLGVFGSTASGLNVQESTPGVSSGDKRQWVKCGDNAQGHWFQYAPCPSSVK